MLAGAFSGSYCVIFEYIHPLTGEDRMVIRGGQGIGDVLLIPDPVAAVLGLAVDGIARNAETGSVRHQGQVVSAGPRSCG